MALVRIRDLDHRITAGPITEWQSPAGVRYRYDRTRGQVGREVSPGSATWDWFDLLSNNLTTAKRKVFDLINEDEF